MKAIIIENKIISLENLLTVDIMRHDGYLLRIHYRDNHQATASFQSKETAQKWLEKIFEIITKNP